MDKNTKKRIYESVMRNISNVVKKHIYESDEDVYSSEGNPDIKIGDEIKIISMKGKPDYSGRTGTVEFIDSMNQIHGTWGGLALQPENDEFEVI